MKDWELVYAAYQRCRCGAGLAHPKGADPRSGTWVCSSVLKGEAEMDDDRHTPPMSFSMYAIEREITTREVIAS